jgi:hypothetical protein
MPSYSRTKTSFKAFAMKTNEKTSKAKQQIGRKPLVLIRGDLHKCLECKGRMQISFGHSNKVLQDGFYPIGEKYSHMPKCSQKDKF